VSAEAAPVKSALIPTWVPDGLVLRTMVEKLPGYQHTYERKTFYRSLDGRRYLEVALRHPNSPAPQVFAESMALPNGMTGIISHFEEFVFIDRIIGAAQITVTGKGLSAEELASVSSSVQVRFDQHGPHLVSVETGDLLEQQYDKSEYPLLLSYTSPDYQRSISLLTDNEPDIFAAKGSRFERNGVHWQLQTRNVESGAVSRFIDGLRSATLAEFHEARMRAEPLNDPGEEPWVLLGFLSGDDRLLNDIELRIRPAQTEGVGFPQNGSHEVLVSYRGGGSGFTASPSTNPQIHRGLHQRGLHLGIVLTTTPIASARTIRDGISESVPTFNHQLVTDVHPVLVFAILRRDDQPPFQRIDFLSDDGAVVHSLTDPPA
jgi:hypothetical protein